uniref:Uncharacterized protein n=1 Tax=Anguilla anguilla TaxID=7936 RepID=A0A0E9R9D7_ANGAN
MRFSSTCVLPVLSGGLKDKRPQREKNGKN